MSWRPAKSKVKKETAPPPLTQQTPAKTGGQGKQQGAASSSTSTSTSMVDPALVRAQGAAPAAKQAQAVQQQAGNTSAAGMLPTGELPVATAAPSSASSSIATSAPSSVMPPAPRSWAAVAGVKPQTAPQPASAPKPAAPPAVAPGPTLDGIRDAFLTAAQPLVSEIKALDPKAVVGFRGSLARGRKGPHKNNAPFDPNDFDVDAYIVSDVLAKSFPPKTSFRDGRDIPKIAKIQRRLSNSLSQSPAFAGWRDKFINFRIFTDDEMIDLQDKGDVQWTIEA